MSLVVFDLEYTSWAGAQARNWSGPGEHREIVQMGAVRLSADYAEQAAFQLLVRPRINPVLSDYFVELTGIAQARLDHEGVDIAEAFDRFREFSAGARLLLSNGDDWDVIEENARLAGIALPADPARFRNIGPAIGRALTGAHHVLSSDLLSVMGLNAGGRAHDALADARAVARAVAMVGLD